MDNTYYQVIQQLLTDNCINQLDKNDIKVIKKCGEGAQSQVYKCEYKGDIVAMKVMSEIDIKCLIHEIAIIVKLECEHIPKFIGVILEEKRISYVTKYISGKTLDEAGIDKLSSDFKLSIVKQLSSVMAYMHKANCIHRDLKAENVMLDTDNKKIYLIDFGIAKLLNDKNSIMTRAKGTMHYLAPEILEVKSLSADKQIVSSITQAVDVWAFCCLVSYIFSGYAPWCNKFKDKPETIQRVLTKKEEFPIPTNIDNQSIVKIIKYGTVIDYTKRKTMIELDELIQSL
jgi:serine/threonine protein kinase